MPGDLRATIVLDYQNVHLTGRELFAATRVLPRQETLIDPLLIAGQLLRTRNQLQRPGMAHAVLRKVLVYRGQPSPEHHRNGYGATRPRRHSGSAIDARLILRPACGAALISAAY